MNAQLVQQLAAGVPITVSFLQSGGMVNFPDPKVGLISWFTRYASVLYINNKIWFCRSYGSSNDFYFKPAVAAPGGNILSTLPTTLGSFGVKSGTYTATPFVAGALPSSFPSQPNRFL